MRRQHNPNFFRIAAAIIGAVFLIACDDTPKALSTDIDSAHSQLKIIRIIGIAISPIFEITQKHYVSTADFTVSEIRLQIWAKQAGARILVNGSSVTELTKHNLAVGNNEFNVVVEAINGHQEAYRLTVTRLPEFRRL